MKNINSIISILLNKFKRLFLPFILHIQNQENYDMQGYLNRLHFHKPLKPSMLILIANEYSTFCLKSIIFIHKPKFCFSF